MSVFYIGPFLLTYLLLGRLVASAPSRIVNVTSQAYEDNELDFDDLEMRGDGYDGYKAYGRSKTALVMLSVHLAEMLKST